MLAVPQKIARAANLQIAHGDAESRTEGGELPDGGQPLGGDLRQHFIPLEREIGVGLAGGTPHAAADLVQLGKPHAVGIFNDERVAVAHIHAGLDEGGADQHINFIVQQLLPYRRNLFLGHFAVGHPHAGAGHHLAHPRGTFLDGLHPVVQIVYLPSPCQLLADGLRDDALVIFQHIGLHRAALHRRLLDEGHVPDAGQRHIQGTGNGRGGQGEHIHPDEVFL